MATRGATTSDNKISVATSVGDFTHTVDAGSDIVILFVGIEGAESILTGPTWDSASANESFQEIVLTSGAVDAGDVIVGAYGIKNASEKTASISVRFNGNVLPAWLAAVNYSGIASGSVGAVVNVVSVDENLTSVNQSVHSAGGNAGNALLMCSVAQGGDMTPATQTAGTTFTDIFNTNTDTYTVADFSVYLAELLSSLPSEKTIDWTVSDENTSVMLELVSVAAGGGTEILRRRRS